jgi:hypothetical protein
MSHPFATQERDMKMEDEKYVRNSFLLLCSCEGRTKRNLVTTLTSENKQANIKYTHC